eukprot:PhF_6_TR41536/c0_g1_i2/m.62923
MLRSTPVTLNYYLRSAKIKNPSTQIRTGASWWSDPERMLQHKLLYFTLGVDSLPLRRVAVIRAERDRMRMTPGIPNNSVTDPTGYKRARRRQINLWYRRIQYQEFWLQHIYTRFVWGKTGYYPTGGGKIAGVAETGVWGYDHSALERYSREPLPAQAKEIYER